jgi:hypothetical protein
MNADVYLSWFVISHLLLLFIFPYNISYFYQLAVAEVYKAIGYVRNNPPPSMSEVFAYIDYEPSEQSVVDDNNAIKSLLSALKKSIFAVCNDNRFHKNIDDPHDVYVAECVTSAVLFSFKRSLEKKNLSCFFEQYSMCRYRYTFSVFIADMEEMVCYSLFFLCDYAAII